MKQGIVKIEINGKPNYIDENDAFTHLDSHSHFCDTMNAFCEDLRNYRMNYGLVLRPAELGVSYLFLADPFCSEIEKELFEGLLSYFIIKSIKSANTVEMIGSFSDLKDRDKEPYAALLIAESERCKTTMFKARQAMPSIDQIIENYQSGCRK